MMFVQSYKQKIGILDFQGDIIEHINKFKTLNTSLKRIKYLEDLKEISHLIIPGGESTVIGRFLQSSGLFDTIKNKYAAGELAIWGTCAGAILLGKNSSPYSLELINVELDRNAYGSQIQSFSTQVQIPELNTNMEAIFIRAPKIKSVGQSDCSAKVLAEYEGSPILCQENNILISTFHPELTNSTIIEEYFLNLLS